MALTIKENNGVFFAEGTLNTSTAKNFQSHLEFILNSYNMLTINIDNIEEIDASGMMALRALYTNALINNRSFYVLGDGCKEIYDDFRYTNVA
ncbi:MAG: hypothetical protein HKN99_08085 [Winogradskyella sp.]|nr:hypothetical protein [Winogradskyella sp.]